MKTRVPPSSFFLVTLAALFFSCSQAPPAIEFGKDQCSYCRMTVIDNKFGGMLVNRYGKALKFDSGECIIRYLAGNKNFSAEKILVVSFENPGYLTDALTAVFLHGDSINSPMGGHLAAFASKESAEPFRVKTGSTLLRWNDLKEINF